MVITAGTLITVGVQLAASAVSAYITRKAASDAKECQRNNRETAIKRKRRREVEKALNSRAYQLEIEEQSHRERMEAINNDFQLSFIRLAYPEALKKANYPLNITPYILQRPLIPVSGLDRTAFRSDICCILTNSNYEVFNKYILPICDETVCDKISSWNMSTDHLVCYYLDVWNNHHPFCDEDIENLKSLIKTPTLTITPFFRKSGNKMVMNIKLSMWGMGNNGVLATIDNVLELNSEKTSFSKEEINEIVSIILPHVMCMIGYNVDVFYWATRFIPPALPKMIGRGFLDLNLEMATSYSEAYTALYQSVVLCQEPLSLKDSDSAETLRDVASLNEYNLPERNIGFLQSVLALTKSGVVSGQLIEDTFMSMYKSWTGKPFSYEDMDVENLCVDDMEYISQLTHIAGDYKQASVFNILKEVIKKDIVSWQK